MYVIQRLDGGRFVVSDREPRDYTTNLMFALFFMYEHHASDFGVRQNERIVPVEELVHVHRPE